MPEGRPQDYVYTTEGATTRDRLRDMNADGQRNFGDTFLGDLLGFDGQAGLQGRPGMMASLGGARRERAIAVMREQGVPLTQQNLAQTIANIPPEQSARPQARPVQDNGTSADDVAPPTQLDENVVGDDATGPASSAGAATAAIPGTLAALGVSAAMMRRYSRTGTTGDPAMDLDINNALNGEVLGPEQPPDPSRLRGPSRLPAIEGQASDVTVTPNPPRTDNALPAPSAPPRTAQPPATTQQPPSTAVTPAPEQALPRQPMEEVDLSADIQQYLQNTNAPRTATPTLPEGVILAPDIANDQKPSRIVSTGQVGPNGEMIFNDSINGGVVARPQNGGDYIRAQSLEALMNALRTIR